MSAADRVVLMKYISYEVGTVQLEAILEIIIIMPVSTEKRVCSGGGSLLSRWVYSHEYG